jgi:2-alkyl-3-oxoalkanoate reductase
MRALVTGGTGFIGLHLIGQLRAAGDDVVALVRATSNRGAVKALGAEMVTGDLDDLDSLRRACQGCDIVYHSAALVDLAGSEADFHRTTVAGTARILQAAVEKDVRRFVQVSSCGVFPPSVMAAGDVIDETTPVPEPPSWFPYGRAKYHAERIVREKAGPNLEWVIIRLGYVYGPGNRTMHTHLEPVMRRKIMRIIGDGTNELAFVYVKDAVRAIVAAGRCPQAAGQTLIAVGGEVVTQRQYTDALADGFGLPRVTKSAAYGIAFFASWIGEYLFHSWPRSAVMRRSAIALTGLRQRINCDRTRKLLGWSPQVRFADGIKRTFEWYHAEYGPQSAAPRS